MNLELPQISSLDITNDFEIQCQFWDFVESIIKMQNLSLWDTFQVRTLRFSQQNNAITLINSKIQLNESTLVDHGNCLTFLQFFFLFQFTFNFWLSSAFKLKQFLLSKYNIQHVMYVEYIRDEMTILFEVVIINGRVELTLWYC